MKPGASRAVIVTRWLLSRALPRADRARLLAEFDELLDTQQRPRVSMWYLREWLTYWVHLPRMHLTSAVHANGPSMVAHGFRRGRMQQMRRWWHAPQLPFVVLIVLSLGIGVNLAIVSLTDRLLFSPPAGVVDAGTLRRVVLTTPKNRGQAAISLVTEPDLALLASGQLLSHAAGYNRGVMTMGAGATGERITVERVTSDYFATVGARVAVGRSTDNDANAPVAVLSDDLWKTRFAGDHAVIGRTVRIGAGMYTVIGIARSGFHGVDTDRVDAWIPLHAAQAVQPDAMWLSFLQGIVRQRTPSSANAADAIATRTFTAVPHPGYGPDVQVSLLSLNAARGSSVLEARIAFWLIGVATLVLMIACANVGNLLLADVATRSAAFATHAALGLSSAGLRAMIVGEVVVLLLPSCCGAGVAGWYGEHYMRAFLLPSMAAPDTSYVIRFVALAVVATMIAAVLIAVPVVLRVSQLKMFTEIRSGTRVRTARRSTSMLLSLQACLATLLIVGAGLFIASMRRASAVERNISQRLVAFSIEPEDGADASTTRLAMQRVLDAVPGVVATTWTSISPYTGGMALDIAAVPGSAIEGTQNGPYYYVAGPNYFATTGLQQTRGRVFSADDMQQGAAPVVVINEAFARRIWQNQNPIGHCLYIGGGDLAQRCTRVVGVVRNQLMQIAADMPAQLYYLPASHPALGAASTPILLARTTIEPSRIISDLRQHVFEGIPGALRVNATVVDDLLQPQIKPWRMGATLFAAAGALALAVAGLGFFSLVSFEVSERRYELAVRAALGAPPARLALAATARTLLYSAIGLAAGLVCARIVSVRMAALLYHTSAGEIRIYAGATAIILVVAVAGALYPARRAARSDAGLVMRG